jgi:hypothetical protein
MSLSTITVIVRELDRMNQNQPVFTKLTRTLRSELFKFKTMCENGEELPEPAGAATFAFYYYEQMVAAIKKVMSLKTQVFAQVERDHQQGINYKDESYQIGTTVAEVEQLMDIIYARAEKVAMLLNVATYNEELITKEKYRPNPLLVKKINHSNK